jgi:predicted ArsR family transcriptional regulator
MSTRRSNQPSAVSGDVAVVAALNDPVRLALYEHVAGQSAPVGRDQAAEAIAVPRDIAAYHLDRLADLGLVDVEFRRLSGKQGPGAGRPSKLYRRSAREVQVSVPPKRYDVAARLFAESVTARNPAKTLLENAGAFGESLGARTRQRIRRQVGGRRLLERIAATLRDYGYEPSVSGGQLTLRNCPFDPLSLEYRDVVCAMNRAVMDGLLTGLQAPGLTTIFQPQPHASPCCVTINGQGRAQGKAH